MICSRNREGGVCIQWCSLETAFLGRLGLKGTEWQGVSVREKKGVLEGEAGAGWGDGNVKNPAERARGFPAAEAIEWQVSVR